MYLIITGNSQALGVWEFLRELDSIFIACHKIGLDWSELTEITEITPSN